MRVDTIAPPVQLPLDPEALLARADLWTRLPEPRQRQVLRLLAHLIAKRLVEPPLVEGADE